MLFTAIAFAVGLYCAWYIMPMPPAWATKLKVMVQGWLSK